MEKNEVETVLFRDIKTPTTVEGFRENLRKYYSQYGEDFTELYVKEIHCVNQEYVLIDELNSLDDLYKFHHRPNISPFVVWKMKDVNKFMYETGQFNSCDGFWDDERRSDTLAGRRRNIGHIIPKLGVVLHVVELRHCRNAVA